MRQDTLILSVLLGTADVEDMNANIIFEIKSSQSTAKSTQSPESPSFLLLFHRLPYQF